VLLSGVGRVKGRRSFQLQDWLRPLYDPAKDSYEQLPPDIASDARAAFKPPYVAARTRSKFSSTTILASQSKYCILQSFCLASFALYL
jgi:hypothetical protein